MPVSGNPDIEVNGSFIRFKKPDGTWTIDIDANLMKIVDRGDINTPVTLGVESQAHGASSVKVSISPEDIMNDIDVARKIP